MNDYLFEGTDVTGRRRTDHLPAASVRTLLTQLHAEGWRDIQMLDDEVTASLRALRPQANRPKSRLDWQFEADILRFQGLGFGRYLLRKMAIPLVLLAAYAVYAIWQRSLFDGAIVLVVAAIQAVMMGSAYGSFKQLMTFQTAYVEGRWADVERLGARLRANHRFSQNAHNRVELAFRMAGQAAAAGDMQTALAQVMPMQNQAELPDGLFETQTATLYYLAQDYPATLAHMEQALRMGGRCRNMLLLDVAQIHARIGDAERSRSCLAQVQTDELTQLQHALFDLTQGILSLREQDVTAALPLLAQAHQSTRCYHSPPLVRLGAALCAAYYALALAQQGEGASAKQVLCPWLAVVSTVVPAPVLKQLQPLGLMA